MRALLVLALAGLGACCPTPPQCPGAVPDPDLDATLETQATTCHAAGVNLKALGCKTYRPDWDTFCKDMLDARIPLRPSCLAKIKTCAEADSVCR